MKILLLLIIAVSYSLNASTENISDDYKKMPNSKVVKSIAQDMYKLILRNEGELEISPYTYIASVSGLSYPPTLRLLVIMNYDKYISDILEVYEAKNNKTNNNKKPNLEKFKLWVMKETRKNTILSSCTNELHRYLLNRGIGIDFEYRILGKGTFLNVSVLSKDCDDTKKDEGILENKLGKTANNIKEGTYTCRINGMEDILNITYSKDTLFLDNNKKRWDYSATKNKNVYANIENKNYEIKFTGRYMHLLVNDIVKKKGKCVKKK